jgi:hypothetical protein
MKAPPSPKEEMTGGWKQLCMGTFINHSVNEIFLCAQSKTQAMWYTGMSRGMNKGLVIVMRQLNEESVSLAGSSEMCFEVSGYGLGKGWRSVPGPTILEGLVQSKKHFYALS